MMTVTIYSIGDINYLELILNALAAFFKSGSFGYLFKIGFLVGLVLALFKGLLRGRLSFVDVFVAFLVFWLMFTPKVKVVIEDMYSGSVKAVNNVPIGPAFIGGAISQIGYRTTELFETAFSLPNMVPITAGGFSDPLTVLIKTRKVLMQHLGQANSPVPGADVRKSFVNYIKDCTLTGVVLNVKTMDDVERNPDVMEGLKFEHNAFGTQLFLGGQPTEPTCREATVQLNAFVTNTWIPALKKKLAADFAISETQVNTLIQRSLDALTGGAVDAQKFMLTAAIIPFLEEGIPAFHMDQMQFAAAQMVQQAVLQRNTQWAAQYSMFERYVRPILTFIEGFTYAIGPLVAFALTLGPVAFRVAGMYLMLSLWIQLWMPILAIINLYIQMAASKQMAALITVQYQYPSIAGVLQSDWILQDWLGVGGLLASSAPALAFMILSGSAVAMTHMVGRLEGGDMIDEKMVTPDIAKNSPVQRISSVYEHTPLQGTHVYGASQNLPNFDLGNMYSAMETYSRQRAMEAIQQFGVAASQGISETASKTVSADQVRSLARSISASHSSVDQYVRNVAEDIREDLGLSEKHSDALTAAVSMALGDSIKRMAKTGVGKISNEDARKAAEAIGDFLGKYMPMDATLGDRYGVSEDQVSTIASTIADRFSDSTQVASELAKRVNLDAREGVSQVASMGWNAQEIEQLSRQSSDVLRATESWNTTRQLGMRFGTSGSFNALNVSRAISSNPGLMRELGMTLSSLGFNHDASVLADKLREKYQINKDQAYAMAGTMLLTGYSRPRYRMVDDQERNQAMSLGYSLIGRAMSGPEGGIAPIPSQADRGLDNEPAFGLSRGRVERAGIHAGDMETKFEQANTEVRDRVSGMESGIRGGEGIIFRTHSDFQREAGSAGEALKQQTENNRLQREVQAMEEQEDKASPVKRVVDFIADAPKNVQEALDDLERASRQAGRNIRERFLSERDNDANK